MAHTKNQEDYLNELSKSFKAYIEKTPLKKRKKIVKKNRDGSVTVENDITVAYLKKGERVKVELKVIATLDAWKKIAAFTLDHPDWFGTEFHSRFANPVLLEISEKNKPRGKQKEISPFINDIKIPSGVLYALFKYWDKKPIKEWPNYLQRLVKMIRKDTPWSNYVFDVKGRIHRPYKLTRYCIEKVYEKEIKVSKLRLFDDPFNFSQTYIHSERRAARFTKFFISKSSEEVAAFVYTSPALKRIFETLRTL